MRGEGGRDTINQSHVLGTISRSMPGPPPKSGSLPRFVAFLDSDVAASSSRLTPTYLPIHLGRCTVSTYSLPLPPCHALYRVTQNRRRRLTTSRSDPARRDCERLYEFSEIPRPFSPRDSRDVNPEERRRIERCASLVSVVDKIFFFVSFI